MPKTTDAPVVDEDDDEVADPVAETEDTDELDDESIADPEGEAETDGGEDDEDEVDAAAPPPRKAGRGGARIQELSRRTRELEQQLEATRRTQQPPGKTAEQLRAEEEARLQYMTPDEKAKYWHDKSGQQLQQVQFQQQFQMADLNDQRGFERASRKNPALEAIADDVEDALIKARARGLWGVGRMDIAHAIIGERALKAAGRKKGKLQRQADTTRRQNTTSPGSSRSNVRPGAERRGEAQKLRERLKDVQI